MMTVREVYEGRRALLPELACAGYDRFTAAGPLAAHRHDDAFELCLINSGSVDWWAGKAFHEVRGGDLFLTRPAELHGGEHAVMNPCELYWFHLRFRPGQSWCALPADRAAAMSKRLRRLPLRAFRSSERTRQLCESLHAEHRRPDAHARAAARATLELLLISVLRDHDAAAKAAADYSPAVARAIRYMQTHADEPFRIADVADAVGQSVAHLHKRFAAETGISPAQWRLRLSIRRAKGMLRDGMGVLEVAIALQFSSSQYFATAFRRVAGLSPREYCRIVRENTAAM